MSIAATHAHAFYKQVVKEQKVWTIRDSGGFPAPKNADGKRAQSFLSSLFRVEKIRKNVSAYAGFEPHELFGEVFRDRWLPGLKRDGLLIGLNWSGQRAMGYSIESDSILESIEF
jgi:hypothetical protein